MKDEKELMLGDISYTPTKEERDEIVNRGKKGLLDFKIAIFYIWLYKIFIEEPYNCKTISDFASRYYGYSRASFYRLLNEIEINFTLNNGYKPDESISSFICQKLRRLERAFGKEALIKFWSFLNHEQEEPITGKLIETYTNMLARTGYLMPLAEFKYKNLKELASKDKPKSLVNIENMYVQDDPMEPNLNFPKNDTDINHRKQLEGTIDGEDSDNEPDCDDEYWDDEDSNNESDRDDEENGSDDAHKELLEDVLGDGDGLTMTLLNIGNRQSKALVKVIDLVRKLKGEEMIELQNHVDQMLSCMLDKESS